MISSASRRPKGSTATIRCGSTVPRPGIYKTIDGGKTFSRLTNGLPTCRLGRIGLDYSRKNPNIVFAIIDAERIGTGLPPLRVTLVRRGSDTTGGIKLSEVDPRGPAAKAGLRVDDVLISLDGQALAGNAALVEWLRPHKPGDKVKAAYQHGTETKEAQRHAYPAGRRRAGAILGPGSSATRPREGA